MFFSQMRFDTVRYSIMASSLCVGCGLFIVTLVSSNHAHHPHQQSSVTLSPLLLFFLSCFGRKWSQSSSRTTWNNSELGALFFCPLPCRPRPADLLPLSIVCPVDCVLSAKGVEASFCRRHPTLNFVRVCACIYALCVAASCSDICFGASVPLKNERGWKKNEQKLLWKTDLKLVGWVLLFFFFSWSPGCRCVYLIINVK